MYPEQYSFVHIVPPVEPTGEAPAGVAVPISLTFPILQQEGVLQIILPREYLSIDQVPVPTNSDVTIRSIPSRVMAVHKFYGRAPRASLEQKRDHLVEMLQEDSLIDIPTTVPMLKLDNPDQIAPSTAPPPTEAPITEKLADAVSASSASSPSSNIPWILARYHHQSTLPAFRRKEIWIELDSTQTGVAARIEKHQAESNKLRGQDTKEVPPLSGEKASPTAPVA